MVGGRVDGWLEFVDHQHRNIVSKLSRPPFLCYRYLCPNFADAEISRFPRCRTDGSHGKMPREGDDDEDEEEGSIVLVRWSRLVKYIYLVVTPGCTVTIIVGDYIGRLLHAHSGIDIDSRLASNDTFTMALSFLFPNVSLDLPLIRSVDMLVIHTSHRVTAQPKFIPPVYDSKDGSYSYFGGDFKTWNVPNDQPGKFTSRQLFKAGSPHTVSVETWSSKNDRTTKLTHPSLSLNFNYQCTNPDIPATPGPRTSIHRDPSLPLPLLPNRDLPRPLRHPLLQNQR